MKELFLLSFFSLLLVGGEHYAKVEPLNRYTIKSSVSGEIIWTNEKGEGRVIDGEIIKIDSKIDKKELQNAINSQEITTQSLKLSKELLPLLKENYQRQKSYFERLSQIESSSQNQRDLAFGAMVSAKNQFTSTRDKILNLQKQLSDIEFKIAMLKDRVAKKRVTLKNLYLYKLFVKKGDYATPAKPLAIVDDLSKAKLTIYLSKEELDNLKNSKIYIQGEESNLKFSKIWREADERFVSSYRAEIVLEPKFRFSSLIKVEIR